jgi:hypothetical protein
VPGKEEVTLENMAEYLKTDGSKWAATAGEAGAQEAFKLDVNVSFPDAEIFGVKLVNGRPTRSLITVANHEDEPVTVLVASAGLLTPVGGPNAPDPPQSLRNMTAAKFGKVVQPHTAETLEYSYSTIMQPQDVTLELKTIISKGDRIVTLQVFKETVSVVEAPVSLFDPQM